VFKRIVGYSKFCAMSNTRLCKVPCLILGLQSAMSNTRMCKVPCPILGLQSAMSNTRVYKVPCLILGCAKCHV